MNPHDPNAVRMAGERRDVKRMLRLRNVPFGDNLTAEQLNKLEELTRPMNGGYIDEERRIIAAGPTHHLNPGRIGDSYVRVVILHPDTIRPDGYTGCLSLYVVGDQWFDKNGVHERFESCTGEDTHKDAATKFAERVAEMATNYPVGFWAD